jgi:hypothetical protein
VYNVLVLLVYFFWIYSHFSFFGCVLNLITFLRFVFIGKAFCLLNIRKLVKYITCQRWHLKIILHFKLFIRKNHGHYFLGKTLKPVLLIKTYVSMVPFIFWTFFLSLLIYNIIRVFVIKKKLINLYKKKIVRNSISVLEKTVYIFCQKNKTSNFLKSQ